MSEGSFPRKLRRAKVSAWTNQRADQAWCEVFSQVLAELLKFKAQILSFITYYQSETDTSLDRTSHSSSQSVWSRVECKDTNRSPSSPSCCSHLLNRRLLSSAVTVCVWVCVCTCMSHLMGVCSLWWHEAVQAAKTTKTTQQFFLQIYRNSWDLSEKCNSVSPLLPVRRDITQPAHCDLILSQCK